MFGNRVIGLAGVAACVFAAGQTAPAQEGWEQGRVVNKIGTDKLQIKPEWREEVWLDTNIYLLEGPSARTDGWSIVTQPGVDGEYNNPGSGTVIMAGYRYRIKNYLKEESENAQESHANGSIEQKFNKLTVSVWDRFDETANPIDVQAFPLQDFSTNEFGLAVKYDFNKFDGEVGWKRTDLEFDPTALEFFSHSMNRFHGGIAYHWQDKTDILGEVAIGDTDYDKDVLDDSDWYEVLAGLRGKPVKKITLTIKTGYRGSDYDDDSGTATFDDDFKGFIFRGNAGYDLTERDVLSLTFLREPVNSISSNFFVATRIGIDWSRTFSPRLKGNVGYYHEDADESDGVADKRRNGFNVGAMYDITRYMTMDAKWDAQTKDTDDGAGEFKQQRFMVGVLIRI